MTEQEIVAGVAVRRRRSERIMIESLEIRNFRCFRSLSLHGLKRFNIIVGENGSGKTALLEAVFLVGSASPGQWLRMRQWRGMGQIIRLTGMKTSYESIFRDLFHNFDKNKEASIRLMDTGTGPRSVDIGYPARETIKIPAGGKVENPLIVPIVFSWRLRGRGFKTRVMVSPDGSLNIEAGKEVYPAFFYSSAIPEGIPTVQFFSELSQRNAIDPVIQDIHSVFPFINAMSLESIAGEPSVCASVDGLKERVPIGAIAGGVNKFVSLMVTIASISGGALLIDEFENGFYYSHLSQLLERICLACEAHNIQIFASTHSYEFLKAMLPSMESRRDTPNEFVLLRAERSDGQCRMKVIGDPSAAIESDFEVR